MDVRFETLEYESLDKKVKRLGHLASTVTTKPDLVAAKKIRNLLVHFKPGRDGEGAVKDGICDKSNRLHRRMKGRQIALVALYST
jgi:hypothetical protein